MLENTRRHVPLLIAVLVVAALAANAVVAQPPDEPAAQSSEVGIAAGINADRVDGKDAVKATTKKKQRAKKLVATDQTGYLPDNIVRPLWRLIQDIPPGFADGVDDGIFESWVYQGPFTAPVGTSEIGLKGLPLNADIHFFVIPITLGQALWLTERAVTRTSDIAKDETIRLRNDNAAPVEFKVRVSIYSQGISPAAVKRQLKDMKVTFRKRG